MAKSYSFGDTIKRDPTGKIDIEASLNHYAGMLSQYAAENESSEEKISLSVHSIFDVRAAGIRLPKPAIVAEALKIMEIDVFAPSYKVEEKKVNDWITANQSKKREDNKMFRITLGPGGGVDRWAEIPLTEEEKKAQQNS